MPDRRAEITIRDATEEDMPALQQLHVAAFKDQPLSGLAHLGTDTHVQERFTKAIIAKFRTPSYRVLLAIDPESGRTVGCVIFGLQECKIEEPPASADAAEGAADSTTPASKLAPLFQKMRKDKEEWQASMFPSGQFARFEGFAVDPQCQGRGIGSRLVQRSVEEIDKAKMPSWAHCTPWSYRIFEKAGFTVMGTSEYEVGGDHGVVVSRHMKRDAPGNGE